ncbi:hypothetical protein GHT06_015158 [Daphnia sinensis]|uniref:Uncharacterized protein n=1 Tax=Daphnia sinensis TaxID=1820382 RepID=A0AAD5L9W4_9CRUS|nr:hypothetical protein GHT06_015158 [Daphnia sinensis]
MNDDVITGGSRIPRTPIQPSKTQINVPLPNLQTVARSLNFDTLPVAPQIAPSTDCTHPDPISEPNTKTASPVVVSQPTRDYSQLKPEGERNGLPVDRSEDLGATKLVDSRHSSVEPLSTRPEPNDGVDRTYGPAETSNIDPTGEATRTGQENSPIRSPSDRADVDLHITCETVPDISAKSNLLPHGAAECDAIETRDNHSLPAEFWNHHQIPRRPVIFPLGGAAACPPTFFPDGRSQPYFLSTGTTPADPTRATSSRNQRVAEEIGQLPGSAQPEQRTTCGGDQTNALANQGSFAQVLTNPFSGGSTTTPYGPTTSTPSRGENRSTSTTGAIRRPPPYSVLPTSILEPTPTHTDYTTQ